MNENIKHLAGVCATFVLCAFVAASAWLWKKVNLFKQREAVVPSVNPPEEKWDRTFSGSDRDLGYSIQQTSDSKCFTRSYGAGYYNDAKRQKTAFKNQKLFK